jgi:hypothetical protein
MEVSGYHHAPTASPLEKRPCTHYKGGYMDHTAGLEDVEKKNLFSLLEFEPRTIRSEEPLQFPQHFSSIYSMAQR